MGKLWDWAMSAGVGLGVGATPGFGAWAWLCPALLCDLRLCILFSESQRSSYSNPRPGEFNNHHEGIQTVMGVQVMPPSALSTPSPTTLSLYSDSWLIPLRNRDPPGPFTSKTLTF